MSTAAYQPTFEITPYQNEVLSIPEEFDLVLGGGSQLPFKGKLDEVQIYNKALTEAEIQALANAK